ncbi:MAG: chromosome segregation protein SMC, partial [Deltaproteobacteria bacterium]
LELGHLAAEVRRSYKVEIAHCIHDYHMRPPAGESAEEEIEKLKQLLERMGQVNPYALEEYEQKLERYNFLTAQARDLTEALDKLHKAIIKINRTSRKRFREAFDAVNAKFEQVFPVLFNGGHAHLQLEPDKDLLEAGVEIIVQPPGKRFQNLELLSGGEKALTAVALLFSMFLVKPTPFCLLDEVDAPLDEANVDRFNRMLRQLSSRSQFVVITHNQRTMEMADRLYGFTMEEAGVSKVVTVKLRREDRQVQLAEAAG